MKYIDKFDIVTYSTELKKLLKERIPALGYRIKLVCYNADVDYEHFRYYLNCKNPADKHLRIRQSHILSICDQLGIDIRIKIIIKDEEQTKQRNKNRVRRQED